jgi:hypothetical protein
MDRNRQRCATCGGSGRQNCAFCSGMGRKSVPVPVTRQVFRFGKYVAETRTEYQSRLCGTCGGSGRNTCLFCMGRGWR